MVSVGLLSGDTQNDATEHSEVWPGDPRELVHGRRKEINRRRNGRLHSNPDCTSRSHCEQVGAWGGKHHVSLWEASHGSAESDSMHMSSECRWHWGGERAP